jgi:tetratricopeptide (TPR) repeat protein
MVCPECGAALKQPPGPISVPQDDEPRPSMPWYIIIGLFLLIAIAVGYVYSNSDACLSAKARRLIAKGEYAGGVEILYDIMKRTGPNSELINLASDGLRLQGAERIDKGNFDTALPLFDEIIRINESAEAVGGSKLNILQALVYKATCHLKFAQDEGKYVNPFGNEIMKAEDAVKTALDIAKGLDPSETQEYFADLYFLSANIDGERAAAFWELKNFPQARAYVIQANAALDKAYEYGHFKEEYAALRNQLGLLSNRINAH